MSKFISGLIFLQIVIITFLFYKIYQKQKNILGAFVSPINKERLLLNSSNKLKYFYEPKPNSIEKVNEWISYKGVYTINSDSLNERFNYSIEKPKNVYRIITLGDSFTYGLYVDTKDNWPKRLEDKLNNESRCNNISKFEVINLGVYGYDIQYSSERFKIRGQKYHPDLVLWFLKNDDLEQINEVMLEKERRYSKEFKASGEFDRLVKQGVLYPSWVKAMEDTVNQFSKNDILNQQYKFLKEFNNYYKGKLIIFTFPDTEVTYKKLLSDYITDRGNSYFTYQITDINQFPQLYFKNDGHLNREGHMQIATDLFDYLTKNKLISCGLK